MHFGRLAVLLNNDGKYGAFAKSRNMTSSKGSKGLTHSLIYDCMRAQQQRRHFYDSWKLNGGFRGGW